jgi:acyl-CoA thioesterase-1
LGGNDGLRALPVAEMHGNLARMAGLAQAAGAMVALVGMRMPPNYGPQYAAQFAQAYTDLARDQKLPLVPFALAGIALSPELMQADDIHPNAAGQPRLLDNIWPALKPLLKR